MSLMDTNRLNFDTPAALASALADRVAAELSVAVVERKQAVMAVSGGKTPELFFHYLAKADIDWKNILITLVDERFVPVTDERSNERLVRSTLLQNFASKARFYGLYHPSIAADLIRALHNVGVVSTVEFITVSSYGAGKESGDIKLLHDVDSDVTGRDILLVDDILESGKTLKFVRDLLKSRGAKRIFVAALLDKAMRRQANIEADFVGFSCPDNFVVGYGMDAGHAFRQLPFVGVVRD